MQRALWRNAHIQPWQPFVSESRYAIANEGDPEKDKINLVGLTSENTDTGTAFEDIDTCDEEECGCEVNGEGDGYVSDYERPSADPRCDSTVRRWRQHECLVINTTTCRIDTRDLAQRRSDAKNDARYRKPAPDDGSWPSSNNRVVESRRQSIGNGG